MAHALMPPGVVEHKPSEEEEGGGCHFHQATLPRGPDAVTCSRCGGRSWPGGALPTGCKYNQVNSHFHCIREGCQFSFLLKHQMTSHARKHMRRMLGKNFDRAPPAQVRARGRAGRLPPPPPPPRAGVATGHHRGQPALASRCGGVHTAPKRQSAHPPGGSTAASPASSGLPCLLSGPPEPDGCGDG